MTCTVRRATIHDAKVIARLNMAVQTLHASALPAVFKSATSGAFTAGEVTQLLEAAGSRILLAERDGQPVGYAYVELVRRPETPFRFAHHAAYLHHLAVEPSVQGHGVGRALMSAVDAIAAADGLTCVELTVWSFNERARTFFARQGFETFQERRWRRSPPGDAKTP